jgi:hypothetical protein
MISWIVASHRPEVLAANLAATLVLGDCDELVVVENSPSIAVAYNRGQARATQPIRCYVHQDVQVLDPTRLRSELLVHCTPKVGMVGVVGSVDRVVPWWEGVCRGSAVDARMGVLDFGAGGECAYLDGLLLATAQRLVWDEDYPGFHTYDHDMCEQQLAAGRRNWCLTGGAGLVLHNTAGPTDVARLNGWDAGLARFRRKWGMDGSGGRGALG